MKRASLLVLASVVLAPSLALADEASLARAQTLFDEGKAQFDAENFAGACPKLEESKALAPGLGVTLDIEALEARPRAKNVVFNLYEENWHLRMRKEERDGRTED